MTFDLFLWQNYAIDIFTAFLHPIKEFPIQYHFHYSMNLEKNKGNYYPLGIAQLLLSLLEDF